MFAMFVEQRCSLRYVWLMPLNVVSLMCGLPKSFDYFYETIEGWIFIRGRWMYTRPEKGIKLTDIGFSPALRSCIVGQTPLLHLVGQTLFFNLYFWTRAIGFIILPSVLLVILNILLIRNIRRAQIRKLQLKRIAKYIRQRKNKMESNRCEEVVNVPQAAFMGVLCVCETFSIRFSLLEGTFPAVFLLVSNMLVMVRALTRRILSTSASTALCQAAFEKLLNPYFVRE
ncbi:unnamed protein product [Strongylus vulgaris]|uniref:G-protein coupled receptors family 1 profile domain-containing protein n=1 Tax=Strongylus vulgaris TaxID=40348 RepID=A0A3P7J646_STRVU|nr:unnamed protein product [Strongylus vulgaris]